MLYNIRHEEIFYYLENNLYETNKLIIIKINFNNEQKYFNLYHHYNYENYFNLS